MSGEQFYINYSLKGEHYVHSRTRCAGHGLEYLILGRIVSNPTF
jgi:hypothetical protein